MSGAEGRIVERAFDRVSGPSDQLLWSRLSKATNREDFAATWLQLQARTLQHARTGVLILGAADKGPYAPVGVFPPRTALSADLSVTAETALADRKGVLSDRAAGERSEAAQCIAMPILLDEQLHGVVAFQLEPRSPEALSEAARRLQWGVAWVEVLIRRGSLLPNRQLVDILDTVAAVMEAPSLAVALQGLVVEMTRVLQAEWVSCGLVRRGTHVHVAALSQAITTSRRQQVVTATASAMQEAFDQAGVIAFPEDKEALPVVTRAHRLLAETVGAGAVLSVPVVVEARIVGVLTVVARAGADIAAGERDFCRLAAATLGPVIDVKRRDDRWIGTKVAIATGQQLHKIIGPRHTLLKLGTAAVLATAAYLSVGTAMDRVTAAATVEGAVQRAVAAPIAGYIAAQGPRAGDKVAHDDVLAKLDDREFQIERARWTSEREQRLREYQQAFADGERPRLQVLKAEIEQSQARIDLLDAQIAHVELRAPIDGIVVKGDLSQMVGAPVQRGEVLFEIAPLDDYRIILKVDERDADDVAVGEKGALILSSLSALPLPLHVTKLTPVSSAEEGRNVFRVEAALDEGSPAIRPGMQGYGKIDIGRRKVAGILSARLVQWLRMTVWRFWF